MTFVKWTLSNFLVIFYIFTQVLVWKLAIFVPLIFHLKKDIIDYLFINKHKCEILVQ